MTGFMKNQRAAPIPTMARVLRNDSFPRNKPVSFIQIRSNLKIAVLRQ